MTELNVMTLNMQNNLQFASFGKRSRSITAMTAINDPDLIGTQELTDSMIPCLSEMTDTYAFYGKRRGSYKSSDERCCILYRKSRFRFIRGNTVWLSDTPDVPGSKFPGSMFPRIMTFAVLEDNPTGMRFTFANTHLDHLLPSVRSHQADVLRKILAQEKEGDFLILTGDFNCSYPSKAIAEVANDPKLKLQNVTEHETRISIRNFIQASTSRYRPIDHILCSDHLTVKKTEIISDLFMGVFPSDHCPVLTIIETE